MTDLINNDEVGESTGKTIMAQLNAGEKVFSFRAECGADAERFFEECEKVGVIERAVSRPVDVLIADAGVEMITTSTLEDLLNIMRRVEDGHVMMQTLRECPLDENSLERDYAVDI